MFLSDYRRLGWHLHIIKWVLVERTEDSSVSPPATDQIRPNDIKTGNLRICNSTLPSFPASQAWWTHWTLQCTGQQKYHWGDLEALEQRMTPIIIIYCQPIFAVFAALTALTTLCWSLCGDSPHCVQPVPICKYNQSQALVVAVERFEIFTPSCWLLAILKSVDPQDNLLALNSQIRVDCSRHLLWSLEKFK